MQADSGGPGHEMQSLAEMTTQSAKIGRWLLRLWTPPDEEDYQYTMRGKTIQGKVLRCCFVSTDSTHYCIGKYKRKGKEPQASEEFRAIKNKFQNATMWRLSRVSLLNEKPIYLGSPIKIVIDLNSTVFQPLLQSTVTMPSHPTPPEDLATLLESQN